MCSHAGDRCRICPPIAAALIVVDRVAFGRETLQLFVNRDQCLTSAGVFVVEVIAAAGAALVAGSKSSATTRPGN